VLQPGTHLWISGALAVFVKDGRVVRVAGTYRHGERRREVTSMSNFILDYFRDWSRIAG